MIQTKQEVCNECEFGPKCLPDFMNNKCQKLAAKTKWTEQKVLDVIDEVRKVGSIFAARRLAELKTAGPKWAVCDENRNGKVVDTMLDVCGFANLKISARGKFFQLAKRLSSEVDAATGHQRRFYCEVAYRGGGWLSVYDSTNRQEMSVNVAACKGHQQVLIKYGIESSVESRID